MFTTILVALDESEAASAALALALELAALDRAQLLLVNVVDVARLVAIAGYATPYPATALEALTEAGAAFLDQHKAACTAAGVAASTALGQGDAVDEIIRLAREHEAGLICIGTHGRKGLAHFFIGSVAEGVLRNADMPVLVTH